MKDLYDDIDDIEENDNVEILALEDDITDEVDDKPRSSRKKSHKKQKKTKFWVIFFGFLDTLALICLFLAYGPIAYFRSLLVVSAMETMTHQYLARTLYSDEMIVKVMSQNRTIENKENTNANEIKFEEVKETDTYESVYEEQILKKDEGNDLYKVVEVSGTNYKGHLIVIYDASRVSLAQSSKIKIGGQQLDALCAENGAVVGINASGFTITNRELFPSGTVIMNGQLISYNGPTGWGGGIVGFNNDNVLVLTREDANTAIANGMRDAVEFGPFLIVNGKPAEFTGNGGYGLAPRTAIAQRKDGIVLFLVIDGRRPGHSLGIDMVEMTNLLLRYKAYNASNLDGGGSSSLFANNQILNIAGGYGYVGDRYLPNAWIVK